MRRATTANRPPTTPTPTTAWQPLRTKYEVAEMLGIEADTLIKWRSTRPGFGPRAVKFDQQVCWRTADVLWWLDVQAHQPPGRHEVQVPDRVLSTREAAEYTRFSSATLNTWRSRPGSHPPPVVKIGSRNGYRLSALNDWIEARLDPAVLHPDWTFFPTRETDDRLRLR